MNSRSREISETTHRGIPVLAAESNGAYTGAIHFGVGVRDEPITHLGITHLVEHLILRGPESHVVHNASTCPDRVTFWAAGTPAEVVQFLNYLARAISSLTNLTEEELQREKKILAIESPRASVEFSEGLLAYRYGVHGLGKAHVGNPTISSLSRADILSWASRWFTSSNAILTFSGSVPPGLEVQLGPGEMPTRTVESRRGLSSRTLVLSSRVGVGFSFVTSILDPDPLMAALEREISDRLRVREGLIYSVDSWSDRDDDSSWHCSFALDPLPGDTIRAANSLMRLIDELRDRELSKEAVRAGISVRRVMIESTDGPPIDYLEEIAVDRLRGRTTRDFEKMIAVTNEPWSVVAKRLTHVLRVALPTLQVAVDDDVDHEALNVEALGLRVVNYSAWDDDDLPPSGKKFLSRLAGEVPAGVRLYVDSQSIQLRGRGHRGAIQIADLVLAGGRPDGSLVLLDRLGRSASVDPKDWWCRRALRRRIDRAIASVPRAEFRGEDPDSWVQS